MWIKICANTNLEDALMAAEAGADALGFVFAPSKRQVNAAQVAAIVPHLPAALERVGVFNGHDSEQISRDALASGLTAVQLHSEYNGSLVGSLAHRFAGKIDVIQVLHWTVGDAPELADAIASQLREIAAQGIVERVLIDSKVGTASGGMGVSFDWEAAATVFRGAPPGLRLIAAGGLTPGNVVQAIASLRPWGVDVASGVEVSPGKKDPQRLRDFIQKARRPC